MNHLCCMEEKILRYQYRPQKYCSGGYYELTTAAGEFLGNVSPEELHQELRIYQEQGYILQ